MGQGNMDYPFIKVMTFVWIFLAIKKPYLQYRVIKPIKRFSNSVYEKN